MFWITWRKMRIFRISFLRGGLYQFRKFTSPRKECMVSLSGGNSLLRIDSIFFGSGEIPVEFHLWPKKLTSSFLNWSFFLFRKSPFSLVVSKKDFYHVLLLSYHTPHVICYPCDSWKTYVNRIKFSLKDITSNLGTHRQLLELVCQMPCRYISWNLDVILPAINPCPYLQWWKQWQK